MITDKERREVARRLRETKAECEERGYPWMCDDLILALGYDHDYEAGDEIFDRLADLIEPSEPKVRCVAEVKVDGERLEKLAHEAAVELTGIDRDALLELADEMEHVAGMGALLTAGGLEKASASIREALGANDG